MAFRISLDKPSKQPSGSALSSRNVLVNLAFELRIWAKVGSGRRDEDVFAPALLKILAIFSSPVFGSPMKVSRHVKPSKFFSFILTFLISNLTT